jgi:ApbE superfamily uncharacterized protein (UPF0280 family)
MQCTVYQPRWYRALCQAKNLGTFRVCIDESDLLIFADQDIMDHAHTRVREIREELKRYISAHAEFALALEPVQTVQHAPKIVQSMARAGAAAGVGPMAAVAGAISEHVARYLHRNDRDIIVENGGDIYAFCSESLKIALFAGTSPFSMRIGLIIKDCHDGMGICTSSGSVGHSLSLGNADAVTAIARDGALADAAATALANMVQDEGDVGKILKYSTGINGVLGAAIIVGKHIGIIGDHLELCCV